MSAPAPYAMIGEFDGAEPLAQAIRRAKAEGFTRLDAYVPRPVEGLAELLDFRDPWIDRSALIGAGFGFLLGAAITVGINVFQYPINVGGRPLFSWPAFLVPTFELVVLCGVTGAVCAFILRSGLPRLNHPVFNADHFDLASQTRFFLAIEATDPRYAQAAAFLEACDPIRVEEVTP